MMWRPMDPQHPAYDPAVDPQYRSVVEDLYVEMDAIVGRTLASLGPDDLLVVMSDHGFASWRRAFNLNTWLRDNGYLALRQGRRAGAGRLLRRHRLVANACVRAGAERALHQPPGTRVIGYRRPRRARRVGARNQRQAAAHDRPSHGNAGGDPCLPPRGGLHADRQRGHRPGHHRRLREGHAGVGRVRAGRRAGGGHRGQRRAHGPGITAWIPTRCQASC